MTDVAKNLQEVSRSLLDEVTLVAVSKTHPAQKVQEIYDAGQRHFGENKVQEMMDKAPNLPADIHWHLIGHLQTNKVKYIAPFVYLIHSVDAEKLLKEIDKQANKNNRTIDVLLQMFIAREETKYGLDEVEALQLIESYKAKHWPNVRICGLMGMATFTENETQVRNEFASLRKFFDKVKDAYFPSEDYFRILCMGMSGDYKIAIEEGSNMVRIGTAIFGNRG